MLDGSLPEKRRLSRLLPNLPGFLLTTLGAVTLAWVSQLTLHDILTWGKDIALIFFSSRTAEPMFPTLGIDMRVIHYFVLGLGLFLSGTLFFLRRRWKTPKLIRNPPLPREPQKNKKEEHTAKTYAKKEDVPVLEREIFSGCLNHFGYLAVRPKDTPIPNECIICQRLGNCMVATVRTTKEKIDKILL
jgi:hypothetical protein